MSKPVEYYHNNIENTLVLIDVMRNHGCKSIIFSSSSTVYGDPDNVPVTEEPKKPATNPYGWTKWMIEQILMDVHTADPEWDVVLLRYFNPIGAHPSGLIGEDPKGIPNNLVPYVAQVAVGKLEAVQVFGNDYPTPDGTGVRDYIHVCDLASGHVAALNWMNGKTGVEIFNLGTGTGTSVLEVVAAFSKACGKELPYVIRERRAGDIAANWCDASKAKRDDGLEGPVRHRGHVPRQLELAEPQPQRLRRRRVAKTYIPFLPRSHDVRPGLFSWRVTIYRKWANFLISPIHV